MLYALICTDGPTGAEARTTIRPEHLAYLQTIGSALKLAGPLMSEDGARPVGSLIVIEADTIDDARAFAAGDPYAKAGAFSSVEIKPYNLAIGDYAP